MWGAVLGAGLLLMVVGAGNYALRGEYDRTHPDRAGQLVVVTKLGFVHVHQRFSIGTAVIGAVVAVVGAIGLAITH